MLNRIAITMILVILPATFALACPGGLRPFNKDLGGKKTCVLENTYVGTLELTAGFNYLLLGNVWIGSEKRDGTTTELLQPVQPGKLVINPGVTIFALNPLKDETGLWRGFTFSEGSPVVKADVKTFISVTRDSQIEVKGTAAAPVVITSAQGAHLSEEELQKIQASGLGRKMPGDWGGLVISGKAKSNKCINDFSLCTIPGEANTGWYGGEDDNHSSGRLEYLQVEYGGDRIDEEKELNGVTFNAVGLGTQINNLAVLYNADDCIEFFGGAAIAKNIFCYKGEDDGVDTADGARVFLQNGIVVAVDFPKAGQDNDRHMVEADSSKNEAANNLLRSHPVLVNFTFVGGVNSQGMMLRRGTHYSLKNSVMVGVDTWCLNKDTAQELYFEGNLFAGCGSQDPIQTVNGNEFTLNETLAMTIDRPWVPTLESPLMNGAVEIIDFMPSDFSLDLAFADAWEMVDHRGAIGSVDWTTWIQLRE